MAKDIDEEITLASTAVVNAQQYLNFLRGMKKEIELSEGKITYRDGNFHGIKVREQIDGLYRHYRH